MGKGDMWEHWFPAVSWEEQPVSGSVPLPSRFWDAGAAHCADVLRKVPERRCRPFPWQGECCPLCGCAPQHPPLARDGTRGRSNQASALHLAVTRGGEWHVKLLCWVYVARRARLPSCSRGSVTKLQLGAVINRESPENAFAVLILLKGLWESQVATTSKKFKIAIVGDAPF